jgi:uncharacterized C2H2 Zn-finger protein|tara:strand:- start:87 stop:230 length:144 start_codon:yes stop_codon:yes gene_type:complete
MNITGVMAIDNGEKCPYCDMIMEENTDSVKHLLDHHAEQVIGELFNE